MTQDNSSQHFYALPKAKPSYVSYNSIDAIHYVIQGQIKEQFIFKKNWTLKAPS